MNSKAIKQAEQRLRKAEVAFERLCSTDDADLTKDAWSDFLTAAGTIYGKLAEGSRSNGSSQSWFGRMKNERKSDPLLAYIHHARNCDEHGIEEVTGTWVEHKFVTVGQSVLTGIGVPEGGTISDVVGILPDGRRVPIDTIRTRAVRLVPVTDSKYLDTYEVPLSHLGEQLPHPLIPAYVAGLMLQYLQRLIADAQTLAK